ncbi:MAG: hypothetical protein RBS80_21060 [Thermoguttaceae bacterium]|jgi:flagellin-like hook-associated protein FlgL|nr:hypothetical protein [Thermoguttaceae bacterium]
MASIIGIPTTRVSDLFIRQRLLNQVQFDQQSLFRLQTQLATGRRYEAPSEDPVSALRVMSLQRLLERKSQIAANLTTNQSYLSNTDVTLSSVSSNMANIRATALGVLGTLADDDQRRAASQQVSHALQSLIDTGNQQFRGRYLFAGTLTSTSPFTMLDDGLVRFNGNEGAIQSYSNTETLFATSLNGVEVFGAISNPVRGSVDLNPRLTLDTRIADLRGGQGISKGSIRISDGTNVSTVDLSSAETIGDIAALIKANPPAGRELNVEVTGDKLRIQLAGTTGNLSIHEVASGTVANELGILRDIGVGTQFIDGRDLDPILRATTSLDDLMAIGVRSWAVLHSTGPDNDIRIEADVPGRHLDGLHVSLVHDDTVTRGHEVVDYSPELDPPHMIVYIHQGASTARDVVAAINARGDVPYTATVDRLDDVAGGRGVVMAGTTAVTRDGDEEAFDRRGLRIQNQNGVFDIDFHTVRTVEDLLNKLNGYGAGLLAEINESRTGINVRSRVSGGDFMIGENGGETAKQLGLRTFTRETWLADLDYGQGVHPTEGTDFTITLADGSVLQVDVSDLVSDGKTIGDVIDHINDLARDHVPPLQLEATFAEYGNGIALIDRSQGPNTLKVDRTILTEVSLSEGSSVELNVADVRTLTRITIAEGRALQVDTSGLATLDDVVDYLNTLAPGKLEAEAAGDGKSIRLIDHTAGTNKYRIQRTTLSTAGIELGLIPIGQMASAAPGVAGTPETTIVSADPHSNLIIRAKTDGPEFNGVTVVFANNPADAPSVEYDPDTKILTFAIEEGVTTANDIVLALNAPAAGLAGELFTAELDPADGSGNDGEAAVEATSSEYPPVASGGSLTTRASVLVTSDDPDNDLIFTATGEGGSFNGTEIRFVDVPGTDPPVVASYTRGDALVIHFDPAAGHTANDIIGAVAGHAGASADWNVTRDPADQSPNSGDGFVDINAGVPLTGGEQTLGGRDVHALETESLFTALIRLQHALEVNDINGVQRAIEMLDRKVIDMNFARAELGARQQGIEVTQYLLDTEEVALQTSLSLEYDADMVEVISNLAARQASFEASLQSMGSILKISLLNYL